jgi:methionyl-tRNA formyltransferase
MRLAFFGSQGLLSSACLARLLERHQVVAVFAHRKRPPRFPSWVGRMARLLRGRPATPADLADTRGIPFCDVGGRADPAVASLLVATRPDLICVAGYRWLLPPAVLARAPLGGLNLHMALLPRHRGLLPYFWVYYHDDRETGLTVHWMVEEADAGDVLLQERFELPRGWPVARLNETNARLGPELLASAVGLVAAGDSPREPQDPSRVTLAPAVRPGTPMVNFKDWDVERVWHFLSGLHPYFREPLTLSGVRLEYGAVIGYERRDPGHPAGTVRREGGELVLAARNGLIRLAAS